MKTARTLTWLLLLIASSSGFAQDLVITNAHIVDGAGRTIEGGSITVSGGRFRSISAEATGAHSVVAIDARGMTVLPGLIDVHRHDLLGDLQALAAIKSEPDVMAAVEREASGRLNTLLSEGFTTVMMPGVFLSAGLEVRRRLMDGRMRGPRLLFSGPGFTAPNDFPTRGMVCQGSAFCSGNVAFQVTHPEVARANVRTLAEAGVNAIKVFVDGVGADLDDGVFAAIAAEARRLGLPVMLHAHRVEDMLDGVRLGVDRLVHVPSDALIADGPGTRLLRERHVAIATTASFSSPQFAAAAGFDYTAAAQHQRLLQNVRRLFDEEVVVAFGTDSPDHVRPMVEVEQLSQVLEPEEIIAALTRNAAIFLNLSDEIGTIAPGKAADLVIVEGNPLADINDLGRVRVVVKDGVVVVDNR